MSEAENNRAASPSDMGEVLDRLIRQAEGQHTEGTSEAAASVGTPVAAAPASTPAGGLLGGLLSNPALLSALPQLLSSLTPLMSGAKGSSGAVAASAPGAGDQAEGDGSSPPASLSAAKAVSIPPDRHTALLCAIKPYLGRERQQAAEQLIGLCRVWTTLQGLGISFPSLLSSLQGVSAPEAPERKEV